MQEHFMIERQGKTFVLYAGLLDAFHDKAKDTDDAKPVIETDLLQIPSEDNGHVAIVHASAGFKIGEEWIYGPFEGIGDASADNVGRMIQPHLIRMAETRAKARALRDLVNVGAEVLEDAAPESQGSNGNGAAARQSTPPEKVAGVEKGGAKKEQKARKSQKDLLRVLAVELRGEEGVERLEKRIGKSIEDLSRAEADEWIDRLTPDSRK